MKRVLGICRICGGEPLRYSKSWNKNFHCRLSDVEPCSDCWDKHHGVAGQVCMDSLLIRLLSKEKVYERDKVIRELFPHLEAGEVKLRQYLLNLSPKERGILLSYSAPRLKLILQQIMAGPEEMPFEMPKIKVAIPEELSEGLRQHLESYLIRVQTRYDRLIENGHSRLPTYVRFRLRYPIRLAVFLDGIGVNRWDIMTDAHLTKFFMANQKAKLSHLKTFLNHIAKKKVFRDDRGSRHTRKSSFLDSKTPPRVVSPEALDQYLNEQRQKLADPEYLIVWLVAKMGMRLIYAYNFSMDRITINDAGDLVIKPANIWIKPPHKIAVMFMNVARKTSSRWPFKPLERGENVMLFHTHVKWKRLEVDIIAGNANLLRASAIYAAMLKGNLDRVTIHETMGVSMPTITKMETLLSSDLHHVCDRDLVKKRNAYILGKEDG